MIDIGTIGSAYSAVKAVKETMSMVLKAKVDAEAKEKITEVMDKLGGVQDTLFDLREELGRLQAENSEMKARLQEKEDWAKKIGEYELQETEGGAVVYASKSNPQHFICPSCINKKEIHILQDCHVMAGIYECSGCGKTFDVKRQQGGTSGMGTAVYY